MHGTPGGPSLLAPAEGSCQQCAILDSSPPCLDRSHDESADHAPPRGHQSRDEFQSGREGRRRDRPCGTGAYAPPGTATYVRYPGVTHEGSAVDADRPAQSRSRSSPDSGLVPPTPANNRKTSYDSGTAYRQGTPQRHCGTTSLGGRRHYPSPPTPDDRTACSWHPGQEIRFEHAAARLPGVRPAVQGLRPGAVHGVRSRGPRSSPTADRSGDSAAGPRPAGCRSVPATGTSRCPARLARRARGPASDPPAGSRTDRAGTSVAREPWFRDPIRREEPGTR